MAKSPRAATGALMAACLLALLLAAPTAASGEEVTYDGTFALAANGDTAVTIKLTLPMLQYQKLRDNISNLYLLLRNMASDRADTEVVEKKADWDDANRVITFSLKALGAGRNLGKLWEVDIVKGAQFSNVDEAKRTFYFIETGSGPMGPIRGTTKLVLPEGAAQFKWDEARRVVSYVMPAPKAAEGRSKLWTPAIILLALGVVLTGLSFAVKPMFGTT